ncbi:MAG: hypothetical protein ACP5D2_00875 [Candidatus Nanoarchaeia archaeon]
MPKISKEKQEKIQEQILSYLYSIFPKSAFTADIAKELARDEEFIKNLLQQLIKKELVISIKKNPEGIQYTRRIRWRLSNKAHQAYKTYQ